MLLQFINSSKMWTQRCLFKSHIPQELPFRWVIMNSQFKSQLTFWKCWFGAEPPSLETLLLVPVAHNAFSHKGGWESYPRVLPWYSAHFMNPFEPSICAQWAVSSISFLFLLNPFWKVNIHPHLMTEIWGVANVVIGNIFTLVVVMTLDVTSALHTQA